ncbi:MAG TPA: TetR/AcrR family transcriptional regulator [Spirochaetales bacterium]|nr:TetR/AcrR family transcriptional regulator [Spirochaetales bacterium]
MPDATKERILSAAFELIRLNGPAGLTMEGAADLAGVSRKTVYNHFTTRYSLMDEAIAARLDRCLADLEAIIADRESGFTKKLNLVLERGFSELRSCGRLISYPRLSATGSESQPVHKELNLRLSGFITNLVQEALESGVLKPVFQPERLTWVLINIVDGLLFLDELVDQAVSKADILKDSLKAILIGILTEEGNAALQNSPVFD